MSCLLPSAKLSPYREVQSPLSLFLSRSFSLVLFFGFFHLHAVNLRNINFNLQKISFFFSFLFVVKFCNDKGDVYLLDILFSLQFNWTSIINLISI